MDSSIQGLEFLDLTGASEHEVGELNNVLYGGGASAACAVILPWTPPPAHWTDHVVHQPYPAAVPPMVAGVQPPPPPLGHAGPPWVTLPPNSGEEPVNGGSEEPVDGVQMIRPTVSTALPPIYPLIHQPSVIVSNVTANVNVHSFQPMTYPTMYSNTAEPPPDSQSNAPRRQRTNKVAKRPETQVRRNVDSPQGNFTSQFSPNAQPYIPPQASYPYYQHQSAAGIPSPQAMAGSPLYLHPPPMQFAAPLMIGPYPPGAVYSTPPRPIEQQDVKETVPYPPQQSQDHQDLAVAVTLPASVVPIIRPSLPAAVDLSVSTTVSQQNKEEEDEDAPVVSAVIENSKMAQSAAVVEKVKNEEPVKDKSPAPVLGSGVKPVVTSISSLKPPFQSNKERKPSASEEPAPVSETPPSAQNQTWAALLFGSQAPDNEPKPTAAIKPTMQNSIPLATTLNNISGSPSVTVSTRSPNVSNVVTPSRKSMPNINASGNKSLPSPCISDDPRLLELGNFLVHYQLEHKPAALQPRGLTNRSNYCYINATLQALLACPPLYNLMKAVATFRGNSINNNKGKSFTPIIDSMVKFMNEFEEMSSSGNLVKSRREKAQARKEEQSPGGGGGIEVVTGAAFEPTYVYKMLNVIRNDTAFPVEGRQEDAEEFLSCLLNGLNDEMLELQKLANNNMSNGEVTTNGELYQEHDGENEWKEVTNARNRPSVTRRTEVAHTPLSQIFQGQLRSSVQRVGNESTDSIQPFFTLPLDIEKAQSVKEALDRMVGKDVLEGVTCTKTNQEVEAWQQVTLEQLPLVLLLHLKCFDYKLHTCSKIIKTVEFPIDLKIEQKLMSTVVKSKNKKTSGNTGKDRQYKLFAVVYHDGKEATKGHYITDVFHVGYGVWVRYDDATVRSVSENQVLHPKSPRVPYLLYYRRQDTINISQSARSQKSES
ncbi:ubiquitin specific protease 10 isoform X2 [Lycorma delicatula]|uniref:ubiquitin specific protease 10 isoform X2 n=1 Tax=Lycorma delicatula TaxID=130591 RepID=UPI003F50E64E